MVDRNGSLEASLALRQCFWARWKHEESKSADRGKEFDAGRTHQRRCHLGQNRKASERRDILIYRNLWNFGNRSWWKKCGKKREFSSIWQRPPAFQLSAVKTHTWGSWIIVECIIDRQAGRTKHYGCLKTLSAVLGRPNHRRLPNFSEAANVFGRDKPNFI